MTVKAYVVSNDEYCTIEFSEHRATAQSSGANELNEEFQDVMCRRAPEFDTWAERRKVPWRVLIEDYGWGQECGHCYRRVYGDHEGRVYGDDQVYCGSECQNKQTEIVSKITGGDNAG